MFRRLTWAALVPAVSLLAACSSGSPAKHAPATAPPPRIIATSAGTLSGTSPTSDGRIWALGGNARIKTLTEVRLRDGEVLNISPADASSTSVAASVTGQLGVGIGTKTTGAIEFRNGSTGAVLGTTPLPEPAIAVSAGDDGTTFYVLDGRQGRDGNDNVAIVDSQNRQIQKTLAVPPKSVAVQPTPDQSSVYVLSRFGVVTEVSVATGRDEAQFAVNMIGIGLAMAPSGQTLFVLGGPPDGRAIARVDLKTDSQDSAVPAAGNSVDIAPGVDDRQIYDYVGTPQVGNLQIIQLPSE
jgi:hypothetical protein